ncbi:MAG TPA: glycosyltransferase [Leptolyngbyaceae cyanobacterium M33_DOE_097]|uniref:Glycosyltransferase n=1 Tax=Oscillatoriales cyanobacterium SpSt-418 TaxID=2282169 RepID=A0A7C3KC15_9CYAN|nr:glycosyltransferase [Leptolyngbyaceae cyanobacterium M33_DOE_097]
MLLLLQLLLTGAIVGSLLFYAACAFFTLRFFRSPAPSLPEAEILPGISILVPVKGLDPDAWENWVSLCQQDYPTYEVLFGLVDTDDPAIPLLQKLEQTYPDKVRLFTGLAPRGINHKDSSLTYLLEAMQHEIIVFVDSDIQVSRDYLRTVTAPLVDPQVGMVTCAFVGRHPKYLGAALASLGRCCDFVPSALIARAMDGGLRFAVGATMAMRKSALEQAGGLHTSRIGSDYNLGKRTAEAGYRVELSRYLLESDTGNETVGELVRRELRWARTIRFNRGNIYYGQAFCFGTVWSVLLLLVSGLAKWTIALTLFTFVLRYLQAFIAVRNLQCDGLVGWLWLLPWRDALSFWVWLKGAWGDRVTWRGRNLQIYEDGLIRIADAGETSPS